MNPFDWRGPEFLLFYVALVLGVTLVAWLFRRALEYRPSPPQLGDVDPYLVAQLRAGTAETVGVAALSLIDRGLISVSSDELLSAVPGGDVRELH